MTKDAAGIIYNKMTSVAEEFFAENPLKRFPEDFLPIRLRQGLRRDRDPFPVAKQGSKLSGMTARKKKKGKQRSRSLATIYRSLPAHSICSGLGGQSHQVRHRLNKNDIKKAMESYNYYKKLEAKMAYEIIVLPEGKFELKIDKKIQIRPEKWPMPLEFDYFEAAKYVLYSRRKGPCVCNLPKDESIVKKAVKKYEKYLKEARDKLVKAFMARNVDEKLAEGFVKLVFEEKLPFSHLVK
jgi:hypothetical protein